MKLRGDDATPQTWIKTRIVRCPKCSRSPVNYREHMVVYSDFEAKVGVRDSEGWHSEGSITHVVATCSCGHKWTLRGVSQVTGLDLL